MTADAMREDVARAVGSLPLFDNKWKGADAAILAMQPHIAAAVAAERAAVARMVRFIAIEAEMVNSMELIAKAIERGDHITPA